MIPWLRIAVVGAILLALIAAGWKVYHSIDKAGYDRAQRENQAAAELQREANRSTARTAETKQVTQAAIRERFIVQTVTEIRHETANLAACPVQPAAIRLLNNAAQCASEDRPASCGADQPVRPAGTAG